MKNLRKISSRWYFVLPLCLAFVFYSCQFDDVADPIEIKSLVNLSGVEIFKGIMLGTGELAERIDFFDQNFKGVKKMLSNDEYEQFLLEQDRIVDLLEKSEPGIFNDFKKDMTSGNPITISESLSSISQKLVNELNQELLGNSSESSSLTKRLTETDKEKLENAIKHGDRATILEITNFLNSGNSKTDVNNSRIQACSLVLVCAFTVVLAATIAVAATGAVAVALYFTAALVQTVEIGVESNYDTLQNEELVAVIAINLKG